jgi:hypothetical protein
MKTSKKNAGTLILVALLALSALFSGCSKSNENSTTVTNTPTQKESVLNYTDSESNTFMMSMSSLPVEPLSEVEIAALTLMREEELLAHDVYLYLSQLYSKPVFKNIRKSEAVHTEAIRLLLVKYKLPDPALNHTTGQFTNQTLQELYNTLISMGSQSLLQGMIVGATIEDMDIFDLHQQLTEVDNRDIILVFNNLLNGSKNHLRAFYANILFLGGSYTPQYISLEEFNAIINQ